MNAYIKVVNIRKVDIFLNFLLFLAGLYAIGFFIGIMTAIVEKLIW